MYFKCKFIFQLDNRSTCLVPEFIHSLAAQLCQAPSLASYREYLLSKPVLLVSTEFFGNTVFLIGILRFFKNKKHILLLQDGLSLENCIINPGKAFLTGIIEPLIHLRRARKLREGYFLVLIDSIGEAECHKISTRDTISSFLSKQVFRVPHWLKFVVTIRTSQLEILSLVPFKKIS